MDHDEGNLSIATATDDPKGSKLLPTGKNKFPPKKGSNIRSKPYPSQSKSSSNPRHGGAAMNKVVVPRSINCVPIVPHFPVFCSNKGCQLVATVVWNSLNSSINRFKVTLEDMIYITQLSWLNRIVQTNISTSTKVDFRGASLLKQAVRSILLPEPIASYIEAFGSVTMLSGISVVPHFTGYSDWFELDAQGVPEAKGIWDSMGVLTPGDDWPIDYGKISDYTNCITRAQLKGMQLRLVDDSTCAGKPTMLCSYVSVRYPANAVMGMAPQVLAQAECDLGAAYKIRDWDQKDDWPGEYSYVLYPTFSSDSVIPEQLLTKLVSTTRVVGQTQF